MYFFPLEILLHSLAKKKKKNSHPSFFTTLVRMIKSAGALALNVCLVCLSINLDLKEFVLPKFNHLKQERSKNTLTNTFDFPGL